MGAAEALGGSVENCSQRTIRTFDKLIVPETKNRPAFLSQIFVALPVIIGVRVLAAIEFDDELRLPAGEVRDIGADQQLTRELRPVARK